MRARRVKQGARQFGGSRRHDHDNAPRVNVTPMIDVIMCLIVFYLLVGNLVLERKGEQDLPETDAGEPRAGAVAALVVGISATGEVAIDGIATPPERIASVIEGRSLRFGPEARVEIRADRAAPYEFVRPVVEACRAARVRTLDLVTTKRVDDFGAFPGGSGSGEGAP